MRQLGERNQELKNILRYGTKEEWYPVYYRPDLLIHTTRVFWITRVVCDYLKTVNSDIFDYAKTLELAKFHDDSEILAGDIISVRKNNFTQEEKENYDKKVLASIDILSESYSYLTRENYKELLLMDFHKIGVEYAIVAFADKFDAHMEICHELFAGNTIFSHPLSRWGIELNSYENTRKKVGGFLAELENIFGVSLENQIPFFSLPEIDVQDFLEKGKAHSEVSLKEDIGYIPYDERKKLHFLSGNSQEKEYLWSQKEFT